MATTFIPINTGTRLGQQLRSGLDQLRGSRDVLSKLKQIMDTQINTGVSPADYSLLESQFGLQAGQGVTAYNLVAQAIVDLGATNENQLLSWCG